MGRRLGQHFLHSPAVLDAIVAAAALQSGESVLEIGPGAGALTERLLALPIRLAAVEVDPELAEALGIEAVPLRSELVRLEAAVARSAAELR